MSLENKDENEKSENFLAIKTPIATSLSSYSRNFVHEEDLGPRLGGVLSSGFFNFLRFLIPIDAVYFLALIIFLAIFPFSGLQNHLGGQGALKFFLTLPKDQLVDSYLFYIDNPNEAFLFPSDPLENSFLEKENFTLKVDTYRMESGDTLSLISARSNISVETLIAFNEIKDVKRLRAGDIIRIPNMNGILHEVKSGDSLSTLATNYDITRESILDANDLSNAVLSLGEKVFLPGARMNQTELQEALGELFIYPTQGVLTSPYGWRNDPISGVRKFHNGIDLANVINTPIYASRAGKVILASVNPSYGKYIILDHGSGYQTLYGHLNDFSVKQGDHVYRGQKIGLMGNTGYSTGSHLHFTVYKNGQTVNPLSLLR